MKARCLISLVLMFALSSGWSFAKADDDERQFPQNVTFTTLITTPRAIEGLTGDNHRNLYVGGSGAPACPVWQINLNNPALVPVGFINPAPPIAPAASRALHSMHSAICLSPMVTPQEFTDLHLMLSVRRRFLSRLPLGFQERTELPLTRKATSGPATARRAGEEFGEYPALTLTVLLRRRLTA